MQGISCLPLFPASSPRCPSLLHPTQIMPLLSSHPFACPAPAVQRVLPGIPIPPHSQAGAAPAAREGVEGRRCLAKARAQVYTRLCVPGQMPLCILRPVATGSHPALTAGSFRGWDWPLSCPLCSPDLPGPDSGRKQGVCSFWNGGCGRPASLRRVRGHVLNHSGSLKS